MSLEQDETRRQLIEIVAEVAEVPVERISADTELSALDVDSLRGLRIVAQIERRWGIVIGEEEIGRIRSMADILALVKGRAT